MTIINGQAEPTIEDKLNAIAYRAERVTHDVECGYVDTDEALKLQTSWAAELGAWLEMAGDHFTSDQADAYRGAVASNDELHDAIAAID